MSQTAAVALEAKTQPDSHDLGERVYFPELDGMRFVAFLFVYLFHHGVPWPLLRRLVGLRWPSACKKTADTGCSFSSFSRLPDHDALVA